MTKYPYVRAMLFGYNKALANNKQSEPDPALPSYYGKAPFVTGLLSTHEVSVPLAGIHYTQYIVNGELVDPDTIELLDDDD